MEYANPMALVSTDWVAEHLHDPAVRLLEVDVDTTAYERGHIAGAVGLNWTTQLGDPIQREIPSRTAWQQLMSASGVDTHTRVIFYGPAGPAALRPAHAVRRAGATNASSIRARRARGGNRIARWRRCRPSTARWLDRAWRNPSCRPTALPRASVGPQFDSGGRALPRNQRMRSTGGTRARSRRCPGTSAARRARCHVHLPGRLARWPELVR